MTDVEPNTEGGRRKLAAEVARGHEFSRTAAWKQLAELSDDTRVDTLEIFESEIVVNGDCFSGLLIWHVTLNYGRGKDAIVNSESFPGKFEGEFKDGRAAISSMTADTSSYYI